ncbi:MAG: response regulator transcription factor, partial [Spirochaetia bacterium]|nr:response regulator transcription factor [Spirochaetia bacterium]
IPVLFLSSLAGKDDILKGLEVGADDYLTKPVDPQLFVAKIQARLRSIGRRPPVTLGTLEISEERQEIRVGGHLIDLTPAERSIVFTLARRKGEAVSRRELLQGIHGTRTAVSSRTVDVWMTALRRKLEPEGDRLETVRGYGYRIRDT